MSLLEEIVIEGTKLEGMELIAYSMTWAIPMALTVVALSLLISLGRYGYKKLKVRLTEKK